MNVYFDLLGHRDASDQLEVPRQHRAAALADECVLLSVRATGQRERLGARDPAVATAAAMDQNARVCVEGPLWGQPFPAFCCSRFTHLCFLHIGAWSPLGRLGQFHDPPEVMPSITHPAALSAVPGSVSRMYVWIFSYPKASAARAHAAYRIEHAFLVPSVHRRVTSTMFFWSRSRATGRPTIATPTRRPSSATPTDHR